MSETNQSKQIEYKVPKGTRDLSPQEAEMMRYITSRCENIFRLCDAQPIDTPIFELRSILMEKYGEEANKEIYELKNEKEEGETLALRFDQTVPFSRYVKTNGVTKMRKYQIGPVCRRDQPNMHACRLRYFRQADFDILGSGLDKETADAECISVLNRILQSLNLTKSYTIKLNSREILGAIFDYCEIPEPLFQTICSSIDKLGKKGWDYVYNEMTTEKQLPESVATKLKDTLLRTKKITYNSLSKCDFLSEDLIERLRKFARLLKIFGCEKYVKLDFTLARGLDYYTGVIFEVELKKSKIGSIAAGGRYDGLCNGIDCVGFALGLDRVMTALQPIPKRCTTIEVKLISPDDAAENVFIYRMQVLNKLRDAGISAGSELRLESNLGTQINKALKSQIPYIVFIGVQEMKNGTVSLKDLDNRTQEEMTIHDACVKILAKRRTIAMI